MIAIAITAIVVFFISWGVMGVKLFNGNYDITVEAWIGLVSFVVFSIAAIRIRLKNSRCPQCGKVKVSGGAYCPYCGKRMTDKD